MTAIDQLKSVLCDPEGKCCIAGSDEDRAIIDRALDALAQPVHKHDAAIKTLEHLKYTYHGGEYWKPPLGKVKALAKPEQPADLHNRLADLHLYEEIAEHYAKCAISPEALRDWVAERVNTPPLPMQEPVTEVRALKDALEEIAYTSMSPPPDMSEEGKNAWHASQAWRFIGIAARAIDQDATPAHNIGDKP